MTTMTVFWLQFTLNDDLVGVGWNITKLNLLSVNHYLLQKEETRLWNEVFNAQVYIPDGSLYSVTIKAYGQVISFKIRYVVNG